MTFYCDFAPTKFIAGRINFAARARFAPRGSQSDSQSTAIRSSILIALSRLILPKEATTTTKITKTARTISGASRGVVGAGTCDVSESSTRYSFGALAPWPSSGGRGGRVLRPYTKRNRTTEALSNQKIHSAAPLSRATKSQFRRAPGAARRPGARP